MDTLKGILDLLKTTVSEWQDDKASRLAAALSFYTMLSLAPMVLIVISIVGLVVGRGEAQEEAIRRADELVGPSAESLVRTVLENSESVSGGIVGTVIGVVVLVFAATGVFAQLQSALNKVWEVEPVQGKPVRAFIEKRVLSFISIIGIGLLLLVSFIVSAVIISVASWVGGLLGGEATAIRIFDFLVSIGIFSLLFAFAYKVLPDVIVAWRDVWIGAVLTAVLFALGKLLLGLYFSYTGTGSSYGAAGSLVVLLVWIYYTAQIFFFGAEFTQVWAHRHGRGMTPEPGAQRVELVRGEAAAALVEQRVADGEDPTDGP